MAIKIRLILSQEDHPEVEEEVFCFDKGISEDALIGLSLDEAKQILKQIQRTVVEQQAAAYVQHHRDCPHCVIRNNGSRAITKFNTARFLVLSPFRARDSTDAAVSRALSPHSAH